jgi:hypothetical protein
MPLVGTFEEAQGTPTSTLWEGGNQHELNELVAELQDAGIPFLSESKVGPDQVVRAILVGFLKVIFWRFGLFRKYTANQMGWRIKVLQSDYPRAIKFVVNPPQHISPGMN